MMANWYTFAIMALFFMGTQRFLYKVSAERRCNTAETTLFFMATVAVLSSILFVVLKQSVTNIQFLLLIALINSSAFLAGTVAHIEALRYIPASIVYPIIRLNVVVVVIFSIVVFKDDLSAYQAAGIAFAVAAMVILSRRYDDKKISYGRTKLGFMCIFISVLCGSVASISSKFAAIHTNKIAFMALSYICATSFSFGIRKKLQRRHASAGHKDALIIGFVMGLINFAGFYSFLKALSIGPLSLIASITGMHFVIATILSVLIYREKVTRLNILGISLTIVSITLLRL
jgi:drug/metabolite transporter (DMT)-like permease